MTTTGTTARRPRVSTPEGQRAPGDRTPLNGAAQLADIGLMGALVPGDDGARRPGFLVHLDGHVEGHRAVAANVKGVQVPADEVIDHPELLLGRYLQRRGDGQTFAACIGDLDADELSAFAALPALAAAPA